MPANETTAKILGYAGLIPFVVFSAGCWIAIPYVTNAIGVLTAYAAIILSFMGAIHWGVTMSKPDPKRAHYFIASTIPALAAWIALLLPQALALIVLLGGFIGLYAYDRAVEKPQALPGWYLPMRTRLTLIVTLCLAAAFLSIE